MLNILPVIMAGGSGTRLWPLSRALYPKQFLALTGDKTLFQEAVQRLLAVGGGDIQAAPTCVVCNDEHRFLVRDQLLEMGNPAASLLLEPAGRNTAPALTLAALHARLDGDPILVVTPADQTVTAPERFTQALQTAIRAAADGAIVTLGIVPDRPETGYGYIRSDGDTPVARVLSFFEKPDAATAQGYLDAGGFVWNSGMFVVRASVWLAAIAAFRPDIAAATEAAWAERRADNGFVRPGKQAFLAIPSESVDYAVMEKAAADRGKGFRVDMVPLDAGWSDLGAWDGGVAGRPAQRRRQHRPRRRAVRRQPQHPRACLQPPGGHGGRGQPGDRRDAGRGARRGPRAQPGRQADRQPPGQGRPQRRQPAPPRASSLGLVRQRRRRAALPGQADPRQSWCYRSACRCTIIGPSIGLWCRAQPKSPVASAKYCCPRTRAHTSRSGETHRPCEPGQSPSRDHRSSVWQLSRSRTTSSASRTPTDGLSKPRRPRRPPCGWSSAARGLLHPLVTVLPAVTVVQGTQFVQFRVLQEEPDVGTGVAAVRPRLRTRPGARRRRLPPAQRRHRPQPVARR